MAEPFKFSDPDLQAVADKYSIKVQPGVNEDTAEKYLESSLAYIKGIQDYEHPYVEPPEWEPEQGFIETFVKNFTFSATQGFSDAGAGLLRLFENIPEAKAKWKSEDLTLQEINEIFESLYITSKRDAKQQILLDAWKRMSPLEVKYFIRILGQGSLRIGFETKSVENAIAKTYSKELETVRYARMISGSIGRTAIMAKNNTLGEATFKMFSPIAFMLASPIESRAVTDLSEYIAEEKFDGMRCQAHISDGRIELFSRDLNEITSSFPEIIEFFSDKQLPDLVLDGEICVFKDDTILPFQLLQKRMGVKKPTKKLLTEFPVLFIAYDILYKDGNPLFDDLLSVRRDKLEKLSKKYSK